MTDIDKSSKPFSASGAETPGSSTPEAAPQDLGDGQAIWATAGSSAGVTIDMTPDSEPASPTPEMTASSDSGGGGTEGPTSSGGGATGGGNGGQGPADFSSAGSDAGDESLFVRFLYVVGFGIGAWMVFCLIVTLTLVQFLVGILNKEINQDLREFTRKLIVYLSDLLAYATFQKDDKPFPLGKFPEV